MGRENQKDVHKTGYFTTAIVQCDPSTIEVSNAAQ